MGAPLTFGYLWHIKAQVGIYWRPQGVEGLLAPFQCLSSPLGNSNWKPEGPKSQPALQTA